MLVVRDLGPDDWPEWRLVRLAALAESPHAFTTQLSDWQGDSDTEQRWRDRLASVPFNVVAQLGDRAVGMVSAMQDENNGSVELLSLWVAPDARGSGVGDALVDAVVGWARDQAARSLWLRMVEGNGPAEHLYRRHGLRRSVHDAPGRGDLEVAMARDL